MSSVFHFIVSAYFMYMAKSSAAKRAASSPPVPPGSRERCFCTCVALLAQQLRLEQGLQPARPSACRTASSSRASSFISSSVSALRSSRVFSSSAFTFFHSRKRSTSLPVAPRAPWQASCILPGWRCLRAGHVRFYLLEPRLSIASSFSSIITLALLLAVLPLKLLDPAGRVHAAFPCR